MGKYLIVPKLETIEIEASNEEDAICRFAAQMDSDMHTYFRVEDPELYEGLLQEATKIQFLEWAQEVLEEDFEDDEIPASDIPDLAEDAWDIYCEGDGYTKYESIEEAVRKYRSEAS